MSDSPMPWVKLYTEILDDTKLGRLSEEAKWRFVQLLALAGECDAEGYLVTGDEPMSLEDIAWRLRVTLECVTRDISALCNVGVLECDAGVYRLPKFADRQGRRQSEKRAQWRNRKSKERAKSGGPEWENDTPAPDVAAENVTRDTKVTPHDVTLLEERRGEESRGEKNVGADAPPQSSPKAGKPRQRSEHMDHPAVIAYRDHMLVTPGVAARKAMAAKVTDLDLWGKVLDGWLQNKWNPGNVAGLLDAYAKGGLNGNTSGAGKLNGKGGRAVVLGETPARRAATFDIRTAPKG